MLARSDCKVMGLYGPGLQARRHLVAMSAIRPIEKVKVYSRSKGNREKFVEEMEKYCDIELCGVDDPRDVATGVDLISTSAPTAIGFSLSGGTIPAGNGTLLVLSLSGNLLVVCGFDCNYRLQSRCTSWQSEGQGD